MYSVWRCVRAPSNASSSTAYYVLKVWHIHLQPSTRFIRCEITINIKHVLPAPLLETSTFGVQRSFQPHQCFPRWLASVFLTSSLHPATAREQENVGGRFGQPQYCSAWFCNCARMIDRVKYKRSCLADPSFVVVVTIVFIPVC